MKENEILKTEDLIHSLSGIDAGYIEEANPLKMEKTDAEGGKAKTTRINRFMPKTAAAVITFVCILALGGGTVWALTDSPLKDLFFKGSDKEFEQVYTEVGKEFIIGNHKVVYEGSSFEEVIEHGYIHLSIWDSDGNPVDQIDYCLGNGDDNSLCNGTLGRRITSLSVDVAGDVMHLVTLYAGGQYTKIDNNNVYIKFSRTDGGYYKDVSDFNEVIDFYKDKPFRFLVLNEDQWSNLKNEVGELNADELITYTPIMDEETGLYNLIPDYPRDYVQPEVLNILEKYDICNINAFASEPQVVDIGNMKFIIGRLGTLISYNEHDCPVDEFILRRENGTEFKAFMDDYSWKFEENLGNYIVTDGSRVNKSKDGSVRAILIYGFILDKNEKVTIEANGKTYR